VENIGLRCVGAEGEHGGPGGNDPEKFNQVLENSTTIDVGYCSPRTQTD
jgi:hypothetical protein